MPIEIGSDVQKRNQLMHEHDRGMTVDEVMREETAVRAELLALIRTLPEERLRAPRFMPFHEWPLWRWLINATVEHHHEHRRDLRAFVGAS
jgi:hypothetical protein